MTWSTQFVSIVGSCGTSRRGSFVPAISRGFDRKAALFNMRSVILASPSWSATASRPVRTASAPWPPRVLSMIADNDGPYVDRPCSCCPRRNGTFDGRPISEGKLQDAEVTFTASITSPLKAKIKCAAALDGDAMTGKAKALFLTASTARRWSVQPL